MASRKAQEQYSESETSYKTISSILEMKDTETIRRTGDVLSLLSKSDAFQIFVLSKNGIRSELDTPHKIGLTKKQYYTRLKQLCDIGLIEKNGNSYVHTTLGNRIYDKHVVGLLNTVTNIKELEMVDLLKKSSKFDSDDITKFLSKIGIHDNAGNGTSKIKIVANYEEMVAKAIEIIEFAQNEIILMTRYPNELIVNSMLKKASMGVTVKVLVDVNMVDGYIAQEGNKMMVTDKNTSERNQVVVNPFYPIKIERKYGKVPFSLLMTDESHVGIEIIDKHNPDKFSLSVYADDSGMGSQMKDLFNNVWKTSSINPPQFAKKTN